ncbi:MAG: hypothetical protein ACXW1Y_08110 [Acidimicrobiia bacterium]
MSFQRYVQVSHASSFGFGETARMELRDGCLIIVSRECETCRELVPVFRELAGSGLDVMFASQDDASFPDGLSGIVDDRELELSWRLGVEVTPTAIRIEGASRVGA